MNIKKPISTILLYIALAPSVGFSQTKEWQSKFVSIDQTGKLTYHPDANGDIIPDFSKVGYYHGSKQIPTVKIVKSISPVAGDATAVLQKAIDEVSALPKDKTGFRGAILIKKGRYNISGSLNINTDGIILRGEGDHDNGTVLVAAGKGQRTLVKISGKGKVTEVAGTRTKITNNYVSTGSKSFEVNNVSGYKVGDKIILFRPGTKKWIEDLQMDKIVAREGTKQWQAEEYNLSFEREITQIKGNTIFIDNPVMMALDSKYGGGEIFKYTYNGRITEVGIENILFDSDYTSDTDEDHGWVAVGFNHIENGWARNLTSRHFGNSCVSLSQGAKNITVMDSKCFDAISVITGGRRYSFNNDGQQNLFMNLITTEGRHDYVTGAKVLGPNVFYNSSSTKTYADIGPHHRWAVGTLYDNITTDGEINVQDRGNWGSGHGWAGVTQVLWNCKVKGAAVQNPWVSGKNYAIGVIGNKLRGRLDGKPEGEWEGNNKNGLTPKSLFEAQRKEAGIK
ncbi:hypothetical protein Pedsa_2053 [Pseudopedobacter saltans DSM 12145]|uniref:Pectate lyase superfamily protein domain-containing protein n=1 Tax=Pseudopedobacter saltans (strain ATCC 51119 / DSM 12145 / JCM 21818 / CCUG 39354 / LMG 10337 / NBRC 100064 / NCIMB 13643) TaxID=762903 RepID=F0SAI5_PSESL|nr:hypothetical protein [Pseudopedobacter saltans]ADY52605.1 hypothetical protein Pedsa_2053 [Pseudopedobacter saltans DSM 12145]